MRKWISSGVFGAMLASLVAASASAQAPCATQVVLRVDDEDWNALKKARPNTTFWRPWFYTRKGKPLSVAGKFFDPSGTVCVDRVDRNATVLFHRNPITLVQYQWDLRSLEKGVNVLKPQVAECTPGKRTKRILDLKESVVTCP